MDNPKPHPHSLMSSERHSTELTDMFGKVKQALFEHKTACANAECWK